MTDYLIIERFSGDELTDAVRREMRGGWQPIGGVAVTRHDYIEDGYTVVEMMYTQAMVKTDAAPEQVREIMREVTFEEETE